MVLADLAVVAPRRAISSQSPIAWSIDHTTSLGRKPAAILTFRTHPKYKRTHPQTPRPSSKAEINLLRAREAASSRDDHEKPEHLCASQTPLQIVVHQAISAELGSNVVNAGFIRRTGRLMLVS